MWEKVTGAEEGDLENPDTHTQPAYTDRLMDFVGAGPPIVSSGPEDDNETRWDQLDSGPQPGPCMRPTSSQRPASWPPTCQRGGDVTTCPGVGYKQGGRQLTFSLRTAVKGATPPVGLHIGRPKDQSQTYGAGGQSLQTIGTTSRSTTTRPTSTSQRLRLRERKTTIQGDQVSAMDEVIAGSQPKQQQGSRGPYDQGRRSRDATNNDVDRGRSRPRPWNLPQFRLRIRGRDGSVTRHHRRQGMRTAPMFPVNSWEIEPELQGSTETLLYAKGVMLYNIRYPRIKVGLDLTLSDDRCYKYLPVVV